MSKAYIDYRNYLKSLPPKFEDKERKDIHRDILNVIDFLVYLSQKEYEITRKRNEAKQEIEDSKKEARRIIQTAKEEAGKIVKKANVKGDSIRLKISEKRKELLATIEKLEDAKNRLEKEVAELQKIIDTNETSI